MALDRIDISQTCFTGHNFGKYTKMQQQQNCFCKTWFLYNSLITIVLRYFLAT